MKSAKEITEEAFAKLKYADEHDCSATLDVHECRMVCFMFDQAVKLAEQSTAIESGEFCDECEQLIPESEVLGINSSHAKSCSLHPENVK